MQQNLTIKLPDGRQLGYAEYGDPYGAPVLYFHGTPGSRLEASRLHQQALLGHYRVLGIDRPGMGLSTVDKSRTVLSWASDIAHLADCLRLGRFSIIGHSGGAPFVIACAYAIPERLNGAAIVSGLAPLDNPQSLTAMTSSQRRINSLIKAIPWLARVMMKITRYMLKNPNMLDKMIRQLPDIDRVLFNAVEIRESFITSTSEAFRSGTAGSAHEMILLTNSWGFNINNVKFPVHIFQGALDSQVPVAHAKLYANHIAHAQLHLYENEGHLSLLTNQINEILKAVASNR